ncbi:hypothetical protein PABG_05911 [Paracoccidioides brasiliensis Pb03]|nr:hypothetical protein PABG_05911 [Paracoccidioides brasiliensis Pb03]
MPPTIFPKLHASINPPETHSAPNATASFSNFGPQRNIPEGGTPHQIFRAKRKHVLKACDRCRCDGNQPCYRCAAYNHPCLFRERKATQMKAYSRGFVQMLESHHALVVKALQQLYTHCVNNECFPGDPIDVVDGNPCTHAILDRLGLIKQAEESPETLEGNSPSLSPCWEKSPMSSDSVETNGLSLEPVSSLELSPSSMSALASPLEPDCVKIEPSFGQHHATYSVYYCSDNVWPMQGPPEEFIHSYSTAGFSPEAERIADSSDGNLTYLSVGTANCFTQVGERHIGIPRPCPQEDGSIVYPHVSGVGFYHGLNGGTGGVESQFSWAPSN